MLMFDFFLLLYKLKKEEDVKCANYLHMIVWAFMERQGYDIYHDGLL